MNITSTQRFPQALKRLNRFKPYLVSLLSAVLVLAGNTQTYAAVTSPAIPTHTSPIAKTEITATPNPVFAVLRDVQILEIFRGINKIIKPPDNMVLAQKISSFSIPALFISFAAMVCVTIIGGRLSKIIIHFISIVFQVIIISGVCLAALSIENPVQLWVFAPLAITLTINEIFKGSLIRRLP